MFPTNVWGRCLWTSIHLIALSYPKNPTKEVMKQYRDFFENLGNVLPCIKCQNNYKRHLKELPIDYFLYEDLFKWTVEMHNIVNKETGKPEWTYEKAYNYYINKEFENQCNDKTSSVSTSTVSKIDMIFKIIILLLLVFIIFLIISYLLNKWKLQNKSS